MDENIPTAEEMRSKYMPHGAINLIGKGLGNGEKQFQYEKDQINSMLVEFAKAHVEAALRAAEEEASNSDLNTGQLQRILNAYPLTNIK